ncbi:MAG: UDP-N-acetylmuramate--L-alanine ligase [Nocardioidaceae bacterium]
MIIPVPDVVAPAEELGSVHLVGIGGAALSGIARLMTARGIRVSGSDAQDSAMLESLRALGIRCSVGHRAEQVRGADTVVVSTAVPADNPEVRWALRSGLRVWPRSAAVQSLLLGRQAVVVTGTHGKTTTTSMLVTALLACGVDPSYAIGSTLNASGLNAAAGRDPVFVVEGDESDAAILVYQPHGAVVTNVDVDHLDFFGTAEAYADVFDTFVGRVAADGFVVCGVDDPGGRRLAAISEATGLRTVTVGRHGSATLRAVAVEPTAEGSTCQVVLGGAPLGRLALQVPGPAYVVDALAALAAGLELGQSFEALSSGLAAYRGSVRRMELKGSRGGVLVYDSYAHHPVEIASDLEAARELARGGRVLACFQPHLFSRTRAFAREMGAALAAADGVVVMDVYPAREAPVPGVSGRLVADAVPPGTTDVCFEPDAGRVAERVASMARPGDLVVTLGAGDVTEVGPQVLAQLAAGDEEPT